MYILIQIIQYIPSRIDGAHLCSHFVQKKILKNLIIEHCIKYWLSENSHTFQCILKWCFCWIFPPFLLCRLNFQFCTHFKKKKKIIFKRPSIRFAEWICSIFFFFHWNGLFHIKNVSFIWILARTSSYRYVHWTSLCTVFPLNCPLCNWNWKKICL